MLVHQVPDHGQAQPKQRVLELRRQSLAALRAVSRSVVLILAPIRQAETSLKYLNQGVAVVARGRWEKSSLSKLSAWGPRIQGFLFSKHRPAGAGPLGAREPRRVGGRGTHYGASADDGLAGRIEDALGRGDGLGGDSSPDNLVWIVDDGGCVEAALLFAGLVGGECAVL